MDHNTSSYLPAVPINEKPFCLLAIIILIAIFGGLGTWAFFAPLDSAVVAPGILTVDTYRNVVQHLEGGIVRDLLVHEGEKVKKGDVLLRLDDTQIKAQVEMIRIQYFTQIALEARFVAEQDEKDKIQFPTQLERLSSDPRMSEIMRTQEIQFNTRRQARLGEISVLEQRIEQLTVQEEGQIKLADAKQRTLKSYAESIADLRKLFASGLVDKVRLREYERAASEIDGEHAEALSNAAAAKVQAAQTKLQAFQLDRDFQKETADALRETRTNIYDFEQKLNALQDTLRRTEIVAPIDGQVVALEVHNEHAVLNAGARILDIVPLDEPLVIDAKVQPLDIDRVHVNQTAIIRFTNFHDRTTPVLEGTVMSVSADRLIDESTKAPYYLLRIHVTHEQKDRLGARFLLPGMPVEVLVSTGERTALEYFIKPLTDAFARSFTER